MLTTPKKHFGKPRKTHRTHQNDHPTNPYPWILQWFITLYGVHSGAIYLHQMVRYEFAVIFGNVTHVLKAIFISGINPDGPEQRAFADDALSLSAGQTDTHSA